MLCVLAATLVISGQWTVDEAARWGKAQKWSAGCNFVPSTAINQLEMWQEDSFDAASIGQEFKLMRETGLSLARIYLHDLAYEADPKGFKERFRMVLGLAKQQQIKVIPVFFDDCWNPVAQLGAQPKPRPGVHNSGWLQSPPANQRNWPEDLPRLKVYLQDMMKSFKRDNSVLLWDLYNEPGNSGYGEKSLPLLRAAFDWGREVRPSQPLSAGAFSGGEGVMDRTCMELSDVVTFHCYDGPDVLMKQITSFKALGRPVICTEWMARTNHSLIPTNLPVFRSEEVSCVQWGLVSGKTNTIFPWGSKEGASEPSVWFHDLFRKDGTPFDPLEVSAYKRACLPTKKSKSSPAALPSLPNRQRILGLRLMLDHPLRDPSVCRAPDGFWYLTGTVEPFWSYNQGIQVWKSEDMQEWTSLGFVWKYGASPWHKPYLQAKKPLWAPEIHYLKGTFWLTYSIPGWDGTAKTSGSGLLKSASGKAEGPYVDVQPEDRMGDEIDASLFEDKDGSVYFLWHSGKIAKLKTDMSGLAEPYSWLKLTESDADPHHHSGLCEGIFGKGSYDHIGYEGMFIFREGDTYFLVGSDSIDGRYSCLAASSKNLKGPYSARYEAIPHGGHSMFFKDEAGKLWSTYFGSDGGAPWNERAGLIPVKISSRGRIDMESR